MLLSPFVVMSPVVVVDVPAVVGVDGLFSNVSHSQMLIYESIDVIMVILGNRSPALFIEASVSVCFCVSCLHFLKIGAYLLGS